MSGRLLRATSLVVAAGCAACGCAAADPLPQPAAAPLRAQWGAGTAEPAENGVVRPQKPDATLAARPRCELDRPPDRAAETTSARPAVRIRAVVNDQAILDEEVRASCYSALVTARSPEEQARIVNEALATIIDREVVMQEIQARFGKAPQGQKILEHIKGEAAKDFERNFVRRMIRQNHLAGEEDLDRVLKEHGASLEMVRRQYERNFLAQMYLRNRVEPYLNHVGHEQILAYYDKHPEEFQVADGVDWQDLFLDVQDHGSREAARAFAEGLAERVRRGEEFAALAKQFDRGDSKLRNHEGTGHKRGEIRPPEAEKALFAMNDGEVAVVEIGSGFHVIRLARRERAHLMPFDDKVQKQIKDKLRGDVLQQEMKRLIADLRRKAVIEVATTTD
jgi:parvulin-like peptidyl-prolyl isomerase